MVSFWFPSPEFFSSSVSLVISGSVILSNKNTDEQRGTGDFLSFFCCYVKLWPQYVIIHISLGIWHE